MRFITLTRPGDNTSIVVNIKHIERVSHPISSVVQGNSVISTTSGDSFGVLEEVPDILDLIEERAYK